jgi:hypothetical protein
VPSTAAKPRPLNDRQDKARDTDVPLTDHRGHISLFNPPRENLTGNADTETERQKLKEGFEDQYTMRFSAASGQSSAGQNPWYSSSAPEIPSKPSRSTKRLLEKDSKRNFRPLTDLNDPLVAIQAGTAQFRGPENARQDSLSSRAKEVDPKDQVEGRHKKRRDRYGYHSIETKRRSRSRHETEDRQRRGSKERDHHRRRSWSRSRDRNRSRSRSPRKKANSRRFSRE